MMAHIPLPQLPKILIAEDNPQTMALMKKYFAKAKERGDLVVDILEAFDGETAIGLISAQNPEIVLCDISMPQKDGFEVLQYFNDIRSRIKFCFFAFCSASPEEKIRAFNAGAMGFISKSEIDYFVMTLTLQSWLRLAYLERKKAEMP